jgi:hypothetical protein
MKTLDLKKYNTILRRLDPLEYGGRVTKIVGSDGRVQRSVG